MSISTYKRWMTESYLPEADDDDKVVGTREKEDGEKVKVTVKQAMDYSGDDKDMLALKDKAKKSRGDDKGGEEKPDTKKGMAISKTGGLGGEPEDKPFGGDTGKDADFEAELEAVKDELKKLSSSARTGTEEIKVINGKKYRAIQESVNKRIFVKEVYKWLKGLEEYRYRKVPGVDVRRISSFVNNGLNETDLPISLQKKWESAKYSKEKTLADRFIKQRISKKLTQTESKHPLKERYDRLFTNKVVL